MVQKTFLALGDSYTIGEGVMPTERWPNLVSKSLNWQAPQIIAKTGWTTGELLDAIDKQELNQTFDFVSLLIGVNNQYRGFPLEEYITEFEKLLKLALNYANNKHHHVLVLSIPDYSITPFGKEKNPEKIAREIKIFNDANFRIATNFQVNYLNITELSKLAKNDSSLIAEDLLHPSAKMYKLWTAAFLKAYHEHAEG